MAGATYVRRMLPIPETSSSPEIFRRVAIVTEPSVEAAAARAAEGIPDYWEPIASAEELERLSVGEKITHYDAQGIGHQWERIR